jgi:hypothetical protein
MKTIKSCKYCLSCLQNTISENATVFFPGQFFALTLLADRGLSVDRQTVSVVDKALPIADRK